MSLDTGLDSFKVHQKARKKERDYPSIKGLEHRTISCFQDLIPQVNSFDLVSFDLFDTVVYRDCALSTIFHRTAEYGAKLIPSQSEESLYCALMAARGNFSERIKERDHLKNNTNEIKLELVFEQALKPFLEKRTDQKKYAKLLVEFETQLEMQALRLMPGFVDFAKKLSALQKRIILISDQYLPKNSITAIIERLGIAQFFDHVFVSSDEGVTKYSGLLFDAVAKDLLLETERCLHIGDNHHNDYAQALRHGWHARHFVFPQGEDRREAFSNQHALFHRHAPFADELTHAILDENGNYDDTLQQTIAQIIAPAFTLYTLESLTFANRIGAKHLFAMTRDGTLFGEIAQQILKEIPALYGKDHALSVKPLALSRKITALANFPGRKDFGWLISMTSWMAQRPATLPILMETYGITEQELLDHVPSLADFYHSANKAEKNHKNLEELLQQESEETKDALDALLFEKRDLMLSYLKQESLLGGHPCVTLDIGYSGTALKFLSQYAYRLDNLSIFSKLQIHQLMFASNRFLKGNLKELHPGICLHEGIMLKHSRKADKPLVLNFGWLEPFTRDPKLGRHMGYHRMGDRIEPIFSQTKHDPVAEKVRAQILGETANCLRGFLLNPQHFGRQKEIVLERLRRFVMQPSMKEAVAVAVLSHDFGMTGELQIKPVVRPIRLHEWRTLKTLADEDIWLQGSAALSRAKFAQIAINSWLKRNS